MEVRVAPFPSQLHGHEIQSARRIMRNLCERSGKPFDRMSRALSLMSAAPEARHKNLNACCACARDRLNALHISEQLMGLQEKNSRRTQP